MLVKKGQTSTSDFTISLVIFLVALGIGMSLLIGNQVNTSYDVQQRQLMHASGLLLSSGVPFDWNVTTVISPGLMSDDRINLSKLERFNSLDYSSKRGLLQLSDDFVFFFRGKSGVVNVSGTCYFGVDLVDPCDLDLGAFEFDDLTTYERITVLDGEIVELVMYSWR